MSLEEETISRIKVLLKLHTKGLTISEIASRLKMNRNSVSKYLEVLLITGQVESQPYGTAKVFFLTHRIPISSMLSITSDLVITFDDDRRVVFCNENFRKFFSMPPENPAGTTIADFAGLIPQDPQVPPLLSEILADPRIVRDARVDRPDRQYYFRIKGIKTVFDNGALGITIVMEEVSAERRYQEELEAKEARYRGIVEDQTEFITRFSPGGHLTFVNPCYARYLGSLPEELLGQPFIAALAGEDRQVVGDLLASLRRENPVTTFDCRVVNTGEAIRWNSWTVRALFDGGEMPFEYQAVGCDSTGKRELADRLNRHITDMEFLSQKALGFIELPVTGDLFGMIVEDLHSMLQESRFTCVADYDSRERILTLRAIRAGGNGDTSRLAIRCTGIAIEDETYHALMASGRLVRLPLAGMNEILGAEVAAQTGVAAGTNPDDGEIYGIGFTRAGQLLGTATLCLGREPSPTDSALVETYARQASIALQKRIAEDSLLQSEELFSGVAEFSPFPISIIETDGKYRFVNKRFSETFGYDLSDFSTGKEWFRLAFPDPWYRNRAVSAWKEDLKNAGTGTLPPRIFPVTCRDGTQKEVVFRPVALSDGRQCVVYEDITERRMAERNRQLLSAIIESADDAVIGKDISGTIISWNRAAERLYGYPSQEIIGKNIVTITPPDRIAEMTDITARISCGEPVTNLETIRIRKDGTRVDVAVTISPIRDDSGAVIGASTIAREISWPRARNVAGPLEGGIPAPGEGGIVGVFRCTGDYAGRFLREDPPLAALLGYQSLAEIGETEFASLFADRAARRHFLDDLSAEGVVKNRPVRLRRPDGQECDVLITAFAETDPGGAVGSISGIIEPVCGEDDDNCQVFAIRKEIGDIIDFIPDPACVLDAGNRVLAWNTAMEALTGIRRGRILGTKDYAAALRRFSLNRPPLVDLIDAPDGEIGKYYPGFRKENGGIVTDIVLSSPQPGMGVTVTFRARASGLTGPQGERIGAIETLHDMNGSRLLDAFGMGVTSPEPFGEPPVPVPAEIVEAIAAGSGPSGSGAVSDTIRIARDGITFLDLSARCVWANDAMMALLGKSQNETITGKSIIQFIASELRKPALDRLNEVRKKGFASFPLFMLTPGGRMPVEASVSVVPDRNGEPVGFVAILRKTTVAGPENHDRKPEGTSGKVAGDGKAAPGRGAISWAFAIFTGSWLPVILQDFFI